MPIQWLFDNPLFFISWVLAIITSLAIHEYSHGLSAYLSGDHTAKEDGRLTLNPLVHIDFLGFLMLLLVGFGWAKPVQINPYSLRSQRWGVAMVSLAGPLSNLVAVVFFGVILKLLGSMLGPDNLLYNFLFLLILVNSSLFIFNLIPIPPLDGSKVLFSVLPDKLNDFKEKFSEYGPYLLLFLVIADGFLPFSIFGWLFGGMMSVLSVLFL